MLISKKKKKMKVINNYFILLDDIIKTQNENRTNEIIDNKFDKISHDNEQEKFLTENNQEENQILSQGFE